MPHNVNRKPAYPEQNKSNERKRQIDFKRIGKGVMNWAPLWVFLVILLWLLIPNFVDDYRLNHNGVATTARVEKTYRSGMRGNIKMVKYYFYVGDSLYYGLTSPTDSVWNHLMPHAPFEIVYEKGNPNNSNWARYVKNKSK